MTGLTAGINLLDAWVGEDVDGANMNGRVGLVVGVFGSFLLSETVCVPARAALHPERRGLHGNGVNGRRDCGSTMSRSP